MIWFIALIVVYLAIGVCVARHKYRTAVDYLECKFVQEDVLFYVFLWPPILGFQTLTELFKFLATYRNDR